MAKNCTYIIPVKAAAALPMAPPPVVPPSIKYSCSLELYTRRRNNQALTPGKHGQRGHGGHHRKRARKDASQTRKQLTLERQAAHVEVSVIHHRDTCISHGEGPLVSKLWLQRRKSNALII
jgi:hypothetical protein